jgi:DNA polymerase elongation subunit (family B)
LDKGQLGYKLTANSLYGQCGAKNVDVFWQGHCRGHDEDGREMLIAARKLIEKEFKADPK